MSDDRYWYGSRMRLRLAWLMLMGSYTISRRKRCIHPWIKPEAWEVTDER